MCVCMPLCAHAHSDVLPSLMLIASDPVALTSAISHTAAAAHRVVAGLVQLDET